jgi:hypothetical protein
LINFKRATITVPELSTQATEAKTKIETRLNLAKAVTGRMKEIGMRKNSYTYATAASC